MWFTESQFRNDINFAGSKFKEIAYFNKCLFDKNALFEGSEFSQRADFTKSEFKGIADFGLATFNGLFDLSGLKFGNLNINWDAVKDHVVNDGQGYLSLVKHFKELQQLDAADDCFYKYRIWRMQEEWPSWNTFYDSILYITCGFGVRPWNTLILSLISIILFAFSYWLGGGITQSNKTEIESNQHLSPSVKEIFSYLFIECPRKFLVNIKDVKYLYRLASKSFSNAGKYIITAPNNIFNIRPSISFKYALYFSSLVFFVALPPPSWQ